MPESQCAECKMMVADSEYHPHAACLMYKACGDPAVVRGGMRVIAEHFNTSSTYNGSGVQVGDVRYQLYTDGLPARISFFDTQGGEVRYAGEDMRDLAHAVQQIIRVANQKLPGGYKI